MTDLREAHVLVDQEAIGSMVAAAYADGLAPVVEERAVDLRIIGGRDQMVAAIRMRLVDVLGDVRWAYEWPARSGPAPAPLAYLAPFGSASTPVAPYHLRDLDYWWSRIPATGRTWRWESPGWMRRHCSQPG